MKKKTKTADVVKEVVAKAIPMIDMNPDIPEVTAAMCPSVELRDILNMIIAKVNA